MLCLKFICISRLKVILEGEPTTYTNPGLPQRLVRFLEGFRARNFLASNLIVFGLAARNISSRDLVAPSTFL